MAVGCVCWEPWLYYCFSFALLTPWAAAASACAVRRVLPLLKAFFFRDVAADDDTAKYELLKHCPSRVMRSFVFKCAASPTVCSSS